MEIQFTQETNPSAETIQAIKKGLDDYNHRMAGPYNLQPLWLVGRDEGGEIQAGLKGGSFFNWFFVDWLWVAEEFRGRSHGADLLAQVEQIAKERGCTGVFLDTYSFQAPGFYEKQGYREFGRVNHFPPGHDRIYFCKML